MRISDWSSDVCSSDLWGLRLEPVILQAAAERYGYVPLDTPKRLENGKGLGGHPDAIVKCHRRGRGILEVKTADWLVAIGSASCRVRVCQDVSIPVVGVSFKKKIKQIEIRCTRDSMFAN